MALTVLKIRCVGDVSTASLFRMLILSSRSSRVCASTIAGWSGSNGAGGWAEDELEDMYRICRPSVTATPGRLNRAAERPWIRHLPYASRGRSRNATSTPGKNGEVEKVRWDLEG